QPLLDPAARASDATLDRAFFSLLHLAQILGQEVLEGGVELVIGVSRAFDVAGTDALRPLHALTQGPALVIPKEIPEIRARVVDVLDSQDTNAVARDLVLEASAPSLHNVVALRGARRYVQVSERSELGPARSSGLGDRPVILFTGGLGGIARTLASHFAGRLAARVVLVSRSALPPPDAWAAYRSTLDSHDPRGEQFDWLLREQAAGHEVLVVPADVTRADDMQRVVAMAREKFGGIDMLVHAAGMVHDEPLALKDRQDALRVLAPKVHGTEVMLSALADQPLRVVLLIGSSSAVLGPPGQIDYVAANAFVNAQAERLRHSLPATRVVALNFGVWSETGMAVNAKLGRLPVPIGEPVAHPLLRRESQIGDAFVFQAIYAPEGLWVLDEHRIRGGSSVLPGTAFVEIARAAGARALGLGTEQIAEISDLMLMVPLELPGDAARHVSIRVEPAHPDSRARNAPVVEVTLSSRGATDDSATEHARALVSCFSGPLPAPLPLAELWGRCRLRTLEFEEGQQALPQDEHLAFGGHWKVVRRACFGDGEAIASLVVPERFRADLPRMALNPALLDMASGFAFSLADPAGTHDRVRVPLSYQRAQCFAPLGAEIVSFVRLRSVNEREGIAVFDFDVADPSGRVLLAVTGYATKSVVWGGAARKAGKDQEPTLFDRWLRQGITSKEGIEIVERLLASDSPTCVTATPTSLFTMLEELRPKAVVKSEAEGPRSAAAPAVEDAPRDEVERQLSSMWTALLGVDSVGIRDDFFELGGHSLIAVRLFSRIKKVYDVDLSLAVLFQAPTIEACAEIIRKELGVQFAPESRLKGDVPAGPAANGAHGTPAAPSRNNFQALVQIQKGNGRAPLFMVHGAGGNVLNFRDLAVGLGKEQTFFGI
ncbi:MAG TPA: SDR family NAD(P)-dependent oxidoreductase, partial [Polyangiaceae bacterium]|nr:SDR family NAD(P)-dependent oxidoreductase [Polyangiaceae bacterium]